MLFILLENVLENVLIFMLGVIAGGSSGIGDRSQDGSEVYGDSLRVDAALFRFAVSWKRGRCRVAVANPDPADSIGNDFCLPDLVILPVLLLMRILVVIRDERDKLDSGMMQQVTGFPPKDVTVRPNQIPFAGLRSSGTRSLAVLLANHVVVIHAADDLPARWQLPVFSVKFPAITEERFYLAAGRTVLRNSIVQKRIVNTDSKVNHGFLRLVSQ